jgi:hypothetical protein
MLFQHLGVVAVFIDVEAGDDGLRGFEGGGFGGADAVVVVVEASNVSGVVGACGDALLY